MKSERDNFYPLVNHSAWLGGPSSPTPRQTLLRPGCRQSPPCALATSGSNNASIPGRELRYTIFILIIVFFASCSKKTETPKGILSKDEMANVLIDFYVKESKINSLRINQDSALVLFQYYRQKRAAENNLTDSIIDKSYRYYLKQPAELTQIYDRIIDSLALKEQRAVATGLAPK